MPLPSDILGVDHVRIAAPLGFERKARRFYGKALGMEEVRGPRGAGVWFRCGDARVHVTAVEGFAPAVEAYPVLRVASAHALAGRLRRAGVPLQEEVDEVDGRRRLRVADPFGNRIELTEPLCGEDRRMD